MQKDFIVELYIENYLRENYLSEFNILSSAKNVLSFKSKDKRAEKDSIDKTKRNPSFNRIQYKMNRAVESGEERDKKSFLKEVAKETKSLYLTRLADAGFSCFMTVMGYIMTHKGTKLIKIIKMRSFVTEIFSLLITSLSDIPPAIITKLAKKTDKDLKEISKKIDESDKMAVINKVTKTIGTFSGIFAFFFFSPALVTAGAYAAGLFAVSNLVKMFFGIYTGLKEVE